MASLSPWEHMGIGAVSGMTEVLIMQPTVGIKNALQEGRPIPWAHPTQLYRGLAINCTSFAPITAIQFGTNRALEGALKTAGYETTGWSKVLVATGAGAVSSAVSGPAELVMIQQQRNGGSLAAEARNILSNHGALKFYKGLSMAASRDGLYTAGYLGVCPALQEQLQKLTVFEKAPPAVTFVIAGITAGISAAIVTHPADTIKTRMQAFLDAKASPEYATWISTMRHMTREHGTGVLFSGLAPRALRIVGATMILSFMRTQLVSLLEKAHGQESSLPSKPG